MKMAAISFLFIFALFNPVLPHPPHCLPFTCGKLSEIIFPFTNATAPSDCGPFAVKDCNKERQKIQFVRPQGRWYEVENISQGGRILIKDTEFQNQLNSNGCESFNFSLPSLTDYSFQIVSNLTLLKCDPSVNLALHLDFYHTNCKNFSIYYTHQNKSLPSLPKNCSNIQLPIDPRKGYGNIFELLTARFYVQIERVCGHRWCGHESTERENKVLNLKLGLGSSLGSTAVIIITILTVKFTKRQCKRKRASLNSHSAHTTDPFSKSYLEESNVYFSVPIFSYKELEEATNNFNPDKELGDGGVGTVYHGKLQDGREVAVKRLHEHKSRRVKLFMNEIEILTRLRHKNLVSLYGCTSRNSHELLLVYEYVPNGTVADHLHGDRANSGSLKWPIRMRIAIETAIALSYLHASDIIHRDVKTNNILLDKNFCVKVADFGISRLFPSDVTHVSTAPQGTPGYVDPEYHQCYQLTDKSDVYSFGVVLVELISSMPAVDITRQRHEINLANFAINKIQKCAFDELIDPSLEYKSDGEIERMTTSVAELAFRCLQQDKEMRPSMQEVLEELETIETKKYNLDILDRPHDDNNQVIESIEAPAAALYCDEVTLLKNIQPPPSPDSVALKWASSSSTTPSTIG